LVPSDAEADKGCGIELLRRLEIHGRGLPMDAWLTREPVLKRVESIYSMGQMGKTMRVPCFRNRRSS